MNEHHPIFACDFDGTLVSNAFPAIGRDIGAGYYLSVLKSFGFQLTLWTCRSDQFERDVREWLRTSHYGGLFDSINEPPPFPHFSQDPRKIYADIYADDKAIGAPLITPENEPPYFDWRRGGPMLLTAADRVLRGRGMRPTGLAPHDPRVRT